MRRPRFNRWIRSEVLQLAGTTSFNMRKIAARAQRTHDRKLAAALLLCAHENDQIERLYALTYDEDFLREFNEVEKRLGYRSIEKLALRGTPMRSLPDCYREFLDAYEVAYHKPERIAEEKRALREQARSGILRSGASPASIARQLGVDPANLNAFLSRGETHRLTLEAAQQLVVLAAA